MKSVLLLVAAYGALVVCAGPHNLHVARHHAVAARAPAIIPVAADDAVPLRKRCKQRPTPSPPTAASKAAPIPDPAAAYKPPTPTTTTTIPPANPTPASDTGSFMTGQGTYFTPGLGACGFTNSESDFIVAVSHLLFDAYPGYVDGNTNHNPICGKKLRATYGSQSVEVAVTDRCADASCLVNDLDFSPSAFKQLADPELGRLQGVKWQWV